MCIWSVMCALCVALGWCGFPVYCSKVVHQPVCVTSHVSCGVFVPCYTSTGVCGVFHVQSEMCESVDFVWCGSNVFLWHCA